MTSSTKILYPIPERLKDNASLNEAHYSDLYRSSLEDSDSFWSKQANDTLHWDKRWHTVSDVDFTSPRISWFCGGKLNVSVNCIDRHLQSRADQIALIWEGNELGQSRTLTYQELHDEVCRLANLYKSLGVVKGDRVALYMPMVPELAIAMLACARIGAIHSVVFAGFSADSLRDRLLDAKCRLLVTANVSLRGPKEIPLKSIADEALEGVSSVEKVIVYRRSHKEVAMNSGRDLWMDEALCGLSTECEPVSLDSEDPLFILYTSGSTGKPKGIVHTQAGYLLYTSFTHKHVFDYRDGDIYFCAADIGWITGHSYIVYGPLANGATTVLFESTPLYPDAGRYWNIVERLGVTLFYTAPTAIRALQKEGDSWVKKYKRDTLRVLGSVGEPINESAWKWYFNVIGDGRCALVDTWWQTETGGILISPLPGATKLKPGSATKPLMGIEPCIVDDHNREILKSPAKGRLFMKRSWPGQMRGIYGNRERFKNTYFSQMPGMYFTGDEAERDTDGYYWVKGRVDDVLNVSGHRLGTAEIESAITKSEYVVESAVVGVPHDIKGAVIYAFCIWDSEQNVHEAATKDVIACVKKAIGSIAVPEKIIFVPGLPKTRSGKIMRRILRAIALHKPYGDTSTLADPEIVERIVEICKKSFSDFSSS